MRVPIITTEIRFEHDVVLARQRARQIAELLGFDTQDQTRIATAVSEIARNAFSYAGSGHVEFAFEGDGKQSRLNVEVSDSGPGIADLRTILEGRYHSNTGMGMGIVGTRRLMDSFAIESSPGSGTKVTMAKVLPRVRGTMDVKSIQSELTSRRSESLIDEVREQNQELMRTLEELRRRQEDLRRLNHELEDTNRGVVALYAELDEKAEHLRRADEVKSRFLSNMSHEFRTPLNSILALSQILLGRTDGDLSEEQVRQVTYIRRAANDLTEIVNDLLDLAKIEAGKSEIRPAEFTVDSLFSALRGMLRPLLVSDSVRLVIEDASALPPMITDEGKVSQILRNFISNALKFTERGEVRVSATLTPDLMAVQFSVSDTGIGIAPADQERIFEEFAQIEHPLQRRVKGTGLGLPLCKRLTELIGGRISLESSPGIGSTFTATVPILYHSGAASRSTHGRELTEDSVPAVVVLSGREEPHPLLEKSLRGARYQPVLVKTMDAAEIAIRGFSPRAIVFDLRDEDDLFLDFLSELSKRGDHPLLVAMSPTPDLARRAGADVVISASLDPDELIRAVSSDRNVKHEATVLIIDDDDVSRYLLRRTLPPIPIRVIEADSGQDGIDLAFRVDPDLILLDLVMPGLSGLEVLQRLRSDERTRDTAVVVVTSKTIDEQERETLRQHASAVVGKDEGDESARIEAIRGAMQHAGISV